MVDEVIVVMETEVSPSGAIFRPVEPPLVDGIAWWTLGLADDVENRFVVCHGPSHA